MHNPVMMSLSSHFGINLTCRLMYRSLLGDSSFSDWSIVIPSHPRFPHETGNSPLWGLLRQTMHYISDFFRYLGRNGQYFG